MSEDQVKVHLNGSAAKASIKSRTDTAKVIATMAPASALYAKYPDVKEASDTVANLGVDVEDTQSALKTVLQQVVNMRRTLRGKLGAYDAAYTVFTAVVQRRATTPAEAASVGALPNAAKTYTLEMPVGIETKENLAKHWVRIQVKLPVGLRNCVIEISPQAAGPAGYQAITGIGTRRVLSHYPPGTYLVRAASTRATEQSKFFGPVVMIVT